MLGLAPTSLDFFQLQEVSELQELCPRPQHLKILDVFGFVGVWACPPNLVVLGL